MSTEQQVANEEGIEHLLSNGNKVLLRVENNSRKFYTGSIWETTNDGEVTILGQVKIGETHPQYVVQFNNKHTYLAHTGSITKGFIKNSIKKYYTHTLANGNVIQVREVNTSKIYTTGSEWNTNNNGKVSVLGQAENNSYIVQFPEGHSYLVQGGAISLGEIANCFRKILADEETLNKCSQCGKTKLLEKFSKCTSVNGERVYSNQCKVCVAENNKIYQANNKETINNKKREWQKEQRKNPLYKIRNNLSRSFLLSLKKIDTCKSSGTMNYVGCTMEELETHINNGQYTLDDYDKNKKGDIVFDCDHIIPTEYFMDKLKTDENDKITKETEPWLYKWWNYRNLRIWPSGPNRSKGADMDYELFKQHGIEDLLTLD